MARKKHRLDEVLQSLRLKHDCRVDSANKTIKVLNGKSKKPQFNLTNDLGNGSWGKIDYLQNVQGYRLMFVAEF